MAISKELSNLTGFPKLPKPIIKLFLKMPWLVPVRIRWKISSKGIGLLMSALSEGHNKKTSIACKELGLKQAQAIKENLQIGEELKETMQVLRLANRLFGINHRFKIISQKTARTLITKCSWADSGSWHQKPCATLSAYEIGLAEGLNKKIKVKFIRKMSKGDPFCQAEYTLE